MCQQTPTTADNRRRVRAMPTTQQAKGRRAGRPVKFGPGRTVVTVRLTPERYSQLKQEAIDLGRSLSEQVEYLVEDNYRMREVLAAVRTDIVTLKRQVFRQDHVPIHSPHGDIWIPKKHPDAAMASRSQWLEPKGREK